MHLQPGLIPDAEHHYVNFLEKKRRKKWKAQERKRKGKGK